MLDTMIIVKKLAWETRNIGRILLFYRFMDGEVHEITKEKELNQYFPIRTDQASSISSLDQYYFLSDPGNSYTPVQSTNYGLL